MRYHAGLLLLVFTACGGSSKPDAETPKNEAAASAPATDSAAPAADPKPQDDSASKGIPDACAGDGSCVMPAAFVKRLCAGVYPDLALYLFAKGTPWRHAYVAVKEAAAFNGLGGPSSDEKLVFEEELLVLSEKKADTGGMQVSGAGASYDCLRWDGTCATLSAEEVRFAAPRKPKHATIPWRSLADATQNALMQNDDLSKTVTERRKECKGVTIGAVSAKCEKADHRLNDLVVEAVHGGTAVPKPAKLP